MNFDDLLALAKHYGTLTGETWARGDSTGDGSVNFDDLLVLARFYGQPINGSFAADWAFAQSLVPEPTGITLLSSVGFAASRNGVA